MLLLKFLLVSHILLVLLPEEICPDGIHPRFKRIAIGPRKHRRKPEPIPKGNPWGPGDKTFVTVTQNGTTNEDEGDDFADYPAGYFLQPGQTDAPDTYDYAEKKFNKPHLVNPDWNHEVTNRNRTYEIEKSRLQGVVPLGPMKSPEPVKSIFGDDLWR